MKRIIQSTGFVCSIIGLAGIAGAIENTRILEAVKKIKDDLTCMNVLLDHYNMFVPKEVYDERRKQIEEIIGIIIADMAHFTGISPNIVRKKIIKYVKNTHKNIDKCVNNVYYIYIRRT